MARSMRSELDRFGHEVSEPESASPKGRTASKTICRVAKQDCKQDGTEDGMQDEKQDSIQSAKVGWQAGHQENFRLFMSINNRG